MTFFNAKKTTAAIILTMSATLANATTLDFSKVSGGWEDPTPNYISGLTIKNKNNSKIDTISWGGNKNNSNFNANKNKQSSYSFEPVNSISAVELGSAFSLGEFVHNNYSISGTALETVDYALSLTSNNLLPILNSTLNFTNNETDNVGSIKNCEFTSTTRCADQVTVSADDVSFAQNGINYYFELLGFSSNTAGTYTDSFITQENQRNSSTLYARITQVSVPAPASILLFALAIVGLRLSCKRKA